jgi:hypothetical protein
MQNVDQDAEPNGPMISGRTLVLVALGVSVTMAVAAWVFRYEQSRRSAVFWGPRMAQLLLEADKVELLELSRGDAGEQATPLFAAYQIARMHDLTPTRGLIYVPAALIRDANFDWDQPVDATHIEWTRALRFTHGGDVGYVLLSDDLKCLAKVDDLDDQLQPLACPQLAEPLTAYFSTAIPEADAAASSAGQ